MTQQKPWAPPAYLIFSYSKCVEGGGESRHNVGRANDEAGVKRAIAEYKKSMAETYGGLIGASDHIIRYEVWRCPGWVKELNL